MNEPDTAELVGKATGKPLARTVNELFDLFGPGLILRALAERVGQEASIAHGEGRKGYAAGLLAWANEIEAVADDAPQGE